MQALGDRIKGYEKTFDHTLVKRTPVIVRVDGRAFHTFTKGFDRPFDDLLISSMVGAACAVAQDMQGFKAAYVQSDEATFLLTDYDELNTSGWFNYEISKIVSTTAAIMSVHFRELVGTDKFPTFDSRVFNVPMNEVVNTFLWRCKDWERNSLQMLARSHFSHNQLHKKGHNDIHEMLYHQAGVNWADLPDVYKNGTFILNKEGSSRLDVRSDIRANYSDISEVLDPLFKFD